MKISTICCVLLVASGLALVGCKKKSATPDDTAAAAAHLDPALTPMQKAGAVSINTALKAFSAKEGHFPADLQELVGKGYMRGLPAAPEGMKYDYDAVKGEVQVVKQ